MIWLRLKKMLNTLQYNSIQIGTIQIAWMDILFYGSLALGFLFAKLGIMVQVCALIIAIVLHEFAHAYIANRFGDPTSAKLGRLTMNPTKHLDIVGSFLLPAFLIFSGSGLLFGWARPVPVQPRYFQHPINGMMWVAIAGPLTNITIALIASALLEVSTIVTTTTVSPLMLFYQYTILINVVLAIFNMVPVPPLDGSRVLMNFLPPAGQEILHRLEPYGFVCVFVLLYLGVFDFIFNVSLPPILAFLL